MELRESGHHAEPLRALMGGTQHFGSAEKADIIRLTEISHKLVDVIDCRHDALGGIMRRNDYIKAAEGLGNDSSLASTVKVIPGHLRL
jgi:hypothetical protein